MNLFSFEFFAFLALVVLLRSCIRSATADRWLLLAASIAFYLSWSVPCVLLILFTSLADYSIARSMVGRADPIVRRRLLVLSIGANLGLLAFFKYTNFLLENVSVVLHAVGLDVGRLQSNIILPPAISYFTFASLAYVIDVYYERMPACETPRDYTLFVTFFPKLLSGPIMRARDFLPQLQQQVRASAADIEIGFAYILQGAVKKLVIADNIAGHVNVIFAAPRDYDGFALLLGVLGYTVQLYCDFAGYSDLAIGCARLLGFRLPDNFQMPLGAATITEFWRRWHITLSHWFRDYLFLPLEIATRANPWPVLRASLNMMVTMLLCGLWHGASWNFVIWGGIHGAALGIHKAWTAWDPLAALKPGRVYVFAGRALSHVLTLGVLLLGFIFFRAQTVSDAVSYLGRLLSWAHDGIPFRSPYILAAVVAVFIAHVLVGKDRNWAVELPQRIVPLRILAYSGCLVLLVLLTSNDAAPFLYFQF
jgi:alginate O-acetyltransferase complex protein AlgI